MRGVAQLDPRSGSARSLHRPRTHLWPGHLTGPQVVEVGKPGPYYNTKALVRQLEGLIAKLPDPSSPAPPRPDRPRVRTARQLDAEETERLIAGYEAGATVFQLGEGFGIDRRTVGMILKRNGFVSRRGKTPAE